MPSSIYAYQLGVKLVEGAFIRISALNNELWKIKEASWYNLVVRKIKEASWYNLVDIAADRYFIFLTPSQPRISYQSHHSCTVFLFLFRWPFSPSLQTTPKDTRKQINNCVSKQPKMNRKWALPFPYTAQLTSILSFGKLDADWAGHGARWKRLSDAASPWTLGHD